MQNQIQGDEIEHGKRDLRPTPREVPERGLANQVGHDLTGEPEQSEIYQRPWKRRRECPPLVDQQDGQRGEQHEFGREYPADHRNFHEHRTRNGKDKDVEKYSALRGTPVRATDRHSRTQWRGVVESPRIMLIAPPFQRPGWPRIEDGSTYPSSQRSNTSATAIMPCLSLRWLRRTPSRCEGRSFVRVARGVDCGQYGGTDRCDPRAGSIHKRRTPKQTHRIAAISIPG